MRTKPVSWKKLDWNWAPTELKNYACTSCRYVFTMLDDYLGLEDMYNFCPGCGHKFGDKT